MTINLERENKQNLEQKSKKANKLNRTLQSSNMRIHHPLYKTRSVDNLIQIGKCDNLNYGTSNHYNYRLDNKNVDFNPRNGLVNRLKQQIITYFSPTASSSEQVQPISNENERNNSQTNGNLMRPIQNLFTKQNNKYDWSNEYSGRDDDLNAVVVGNNLAFKDDDEDDNFRKEYQLSQLKYQRSLHNSQYQHHQNNSIKQFNSLQYGAQNENHQQSDAQHYRNSNNQPQKTNLIKYHQQTVNDLSQVDSIQSMNQLNPFVNVNLNNDFAQSNYNPYQNQNLNRNKRHDEMDFSCKGNSTQTNDLNDLSLTSSSQFISVPLDDEKANESTQIDNRLNCTTAEIHAAGDQSFDNQTDRAINQNNLEDFKSKNKDKPRASSMNDLPNESKYVSMNPDTAYNDQLDSFKPNYQQTTLERAISLDLGNQKDQTDLTNLKLSKSIYSNKFTKEDQSKTKRLIKMKNQSNLVPLPKNQTSSSLSDVNYEQKYRLSNEKISQSLNSGSLATSLTASLSNCKLNGNQSKSIRNSLSTNSTCSSPTSLPSASSDLEYKDESLAYMLKSSSEENQSILINNKNDKEISSHLDRQHLDEAELSKESILFVNDQYKTRNMIDDKESLNEKEESIDLFSNKEQAKKIINDVFTMSSIRSLHSDTIKKDQQLQSELFQLNNQIDNNKLIDQSDKINTDKIGTKGSISNFKISSIKKEIPFRSNLINDTASKDPFSKTENPSTTNTSASVTEMTNLLINKSKDLNDNQSINKENEMRSKKDQSYSHQNIDDDEIVELRNKVAKLKKEFSLRQKLIENQNQQNNFSRSRKSSNASDHQAVGSKTILTIKDNKDKQQNKSENGSILKKQEQILNSTALDFESFVFIKE